MKENNTRDPAIKLFGKNIPLTGDVKPPVVFGKGFSSLYTVEEEEEEEVKTEKEYSAGEITDATQEEEDGDDSDVQIQNTEESGNQKPLSGTNANPQIPINEESGKSGNSRTDKQQNDGKNRQEKTLKKPSKILLCPRCNSMDTKFCYYNNYNTNQPRHFCKACQRYWTAGGTMRSVPVGAGRRKSKNSTSHYRHITISQALQAAHIQAPNGTFNVPAVKTDGRVLCFGLDTPIRDSMASILNLADKKVSNGARNGFRNFEGKSIQVPCRGGEIGGGDDCSSRSSLTVLNSMEEGGRVCTQEPFSGFTTQIPYLLGFPWNYPWNSALPPPPPPGFCPGFPLSFYPPFWNCAIASGAWNIPLLSPQSSSSSSNQIAPSNPGSPTLGKHSRDVDSLKQDDPEKEQSRKHKNGCVLVPKILRIDDPDEAAKSSIWATLGIRNETFNNGGSLFKGLQSKNDEKHHVPEISAALRANPAALSRSANFHESA